MSDRPLSYQYKPALLGTPWELRLAPQALEWQVGRRSGHVPYDRIARVRLSYRPASMQTHRFVTEIWSADGPKLLIVSTSWRGMMDLERRDADYSAFVGELHRRLAAARSPALLTAGSPPFLYWTGLAIFTVASLALAALTVRAVQVEAWGGAALVGGFLALFLWQVGTFFRRNRPGTYRAEALPSELLPGS